MKNIYVTDCGAVPETGDCTDSIQKALDAATPGDTVIVPAVGTFMVDALRGVLPRSGTVLDIQGRLKALPNDQTDSAVVNVRDVSDVTVKGSGSIIGERYEHLVPGQLGRHGTCLQIFNSSNIKAGYGLTCAKGWGDGIYVQDSKDVTVDGAICTDNSRNGMSIISAEKMLVTRSVFSLTHSVSPMPQAGIDIEPDLPQQSLINIVITGNQFLKNKGAGVYLAFAPSANRRQVHVINNAYDQHYKDGSGPRIGGRNTPLCNFLFAACRWVPGYDYWGFPISFDLS
jgi:hypothetical protein